MRVLFETVWGGPQTDVLDFDGKIELVFPSTNFFPSFLSSSKNFEEGKKIRFSYIWQYSDKF